MGRNRNLGPGLADLLDKSHQKYDRGLSIINEIVELGNEKNDYTSTFKSSLRGKMLTSGLIDGEGHEEIEEIFVAHGEASPNETGAKAGTPAFDAPQRMAESRAQVRVMRLATNTGETASEEMPSEDSPQQSSNPARSSGSSKPSGGHSGDDRSAMPATQKQVSYLAALAEDNFDAWNEWAEENDVEVDFDDEDFEITRGQASEAIEHLK